jgi:hypothetical protein
LIFGLFRSSQTFEINCKYYGYEWNKLGDRYTCGATPKDVMIQDEKSAKVSLITGVHSANKTDDDVIAVEFSGQKTYFLVKNLLDFFPNMLELYVFRSDLKHLSRSDFKSYENLTAVSLSRNHLSTLPYDTFEDLTNMEYFSLSFNQLTAIPNLKTMSKLKELYLFENSIESFLKDDIVGNPDLEVIWLYHNKLRTIDPRIFGHLPSLREVDFTNNNCIDRKYSKEFTVNGTDEALVSFVDEIKKTCVLDNNVE